jgi:isocitrate dehydrogenase (NAD+)
MCRAFSVLGRGLELRQILTKLQCKYQRRRVGVAYQSRIRWCSRRVQGGGFPLKYEATMRHTITLIPGDGIGLEVSHAVQEILAAAGVDILWDVIPARAEIERRGQDFMQAGVLESIRKNKVALKGPLATASVGGPPSINVGLRKALDLYANVRPVKNLEGVQARFLGVDIVLIRENTEDLYAGLEHTVVPGVVESLKIITEKASTRVAKFAFEFARKYGRKKIHAIHKANIMKLSDGLFLTSVRKVAEAYPEIEYKELIVDNACMQMVINPHQFDMLLLTNLYGDIMSDLAAGLVGGLGVVPSGNMGESVAIFEAVHGTAPDIAGKGIANPTALLMSAIMMLRHLGEMGAAQRIEEALHRVYREGKSLTRDVGGKASTAEFTGAVIAAFA